jgi:hypothetical protein
MSDRQMIGRLLCDWSGSSEVDAAASLADSWQGTDGPFLPRGVERLIASLQSAFGGRNDKRRVMFLRVDDFAGEGWNLKSGGDIFNFVTAHIEDRVIAVLQRWAGLPDIPDTSVRVCVLWARNHASACSFGTPDLVERLIGEFRERRITLVPADFDENGDIQTVDHLIGAVAGSPLR